MVIVGDVDQHPPKSPTPTPLPAPAPAQYLPATVTPRPNRNNDQSQKQECTPLNISTLNARSLRTDEKLLELETAIESIKWDIVGLSEVRRLGEGIEDHGKYILCFKGETPGMYGVGFLIKKHLSSKIEEFIGVSERIAILNIRLPTKNDKEEQWTIIQAYAPTEPKKRKNKEDIKRCEEFYIKLTKTMERVHKNLINLDRGIYR